MKVRNTTQVLGRLRTLMQQRCLQAYIVPTEDEHLGEYSSHDETRRSYISGFTGSRGVAIVTDKSAALWTDGRYFLQAANEIDDNWILMKEGKIEMRLQAHQCSLSTLQKLLRNIDDTDGGEYSSHDETRRSYISGFTGSRGVAIVTDKSAALWTDGRYFLQAANEIDDNWILMKEGLPDTPDHTDWLRKELPSGGDVGADPFLIRASHWTCLTQRLANFDLNLVGVAPNMVVDVWDAHWTCLTQRLANFDLNLVGVAPNIVDEVWDGKPPRPTTPLSIQPVSIAGKEWEDKVRDVQKKLIDKRAVAMVITELDDIAWLLNLRGRDIDCHPLFYSYIIVDHTDIHLFIDECRLDDPVRAHLGLTSDLPSTRIKVHTHKYDSIQSHITHLSSTKEGKIWISEESSQALVSSVKPKSRMSQATPVAEMKALKNEVEVAAMRLAHVKDAVSLCEFFHWLHNEVPSGKVTEVSAAKKLHEFKQGQQGYMGRSFEFISSVGGNASVIHYALLPEDLHYKAKLACRLLESILFNIKKDPILYEGTTDVTRVLHFGIPTQFERECYTLVLKGHITVSNCVFPEGIKGSRLDTLARSALWERGLDYLHGTGHGVGQYLCVHEGPYGINPRFTPNELNLKENMIISNEPGYYEDGKFGVRIESLVQVVKAKTQHNYRGKQFYTFDEVTLVPLELKLIDKSMLTPKEVDWLNTYHTRIRNVIGDELTAQGKHDVCEWLTDNTQTI